ncbi:Uu.00g046290.m01.CDS01 [Anthostomella pinea]|uniref:Uu.00g046290.m01.CDS01 n=1 Tax=Anthostomella pinea TaxID=933095 RepID=A0AAI8VCB6_9PEZI|nr:Uu.00g046290.m01.CDS01 [Anthostomella pinea]
MVGFVGRFRKPKSPIVLGSPPRDDTVPLRAPTPRDIVPVPPVLRNFSYPTSVGSNIQLPSFPSAPREGQSTWNQLGELYSFSPDSASRAGQARTAGLEDPFFFTSDRAPYTPLSDQDDKLSTNSQNSRTLGLESPSQEKPKKSTENCEPKDKGLKLPKDHSVGDHIFTQKSTVAARLKRNSLGHHKTTSSFDASRFMIFPSASPERPVSSSGVPVVDTKIKHISSISKTEQSSLSIPQKSVRDFSANPDDQAFVSSVIAHSLQMGSIPPRVASRGRLGTNYDTHDNASDRSRNGPASNSAKRKGKDGKGRWFSQLKDWVSVSEPSTQALKTYKKDTYKRAGIALDDPRASAKLHLPVGTLPAEAIKPAGRGPDPEVIALKRAEQQKKTRESYTGISGTSQGSQSSGSHYSSSSSVALSGEREYV